MNPELQARLDAALAKIRDIAGGDVTMVDVIEYVSDNLKKDDGDGSLFAIGEDEPFQPQG